MKNLTIVISFFLLSCSNRVAFRDIPSPIKINFDTIPLLNYQLIRIDTSSYKYNNIFYASRNDSIYKIVSKKEKMEPCEYLQENNFYPLRIKGVRSKMILNYLDIGGTRMYGGETVIFERDSGIIWDLYITPYIKDLCYQED